ARPIATGPTRACEPTRETNAKAGGASAGLLLFAACRMTAGPTYVVDVLVPVAVDTAYSYRAPADWRLEPGAYVGVPLGTRHATGVVWAVRGAGGDNLKSVAAVRDWPPLREPLRDFVDWVARWTLAPRGMVLRMAIRAHEVLEPPSPRFGVTATGKALARMTEARRKVLAALMGAAAPIAKS